MPIANSRKRNVIFACISISWAIASIALLPGFAQTPTPTSTSTPTGSPQSTPSSTPAATPVEQIEKTWKASQLPLIVLGSGWVIYLVVLIAKPIWLLKLPATDITVPFTTWKIPLGLVRWLKYRSRVLDVWVEDYWEKAKDQFLRLPTVEARNIHISLPVKLNQTLVDDLKSQDLTDVFKRKAAVLLITGEGGAGKTSLACRIALLGLEQKLCSHRMLPVLIETELDDKKTLVETIRAQLRVLTDQAEPISLELVQKLLQRQRILVIVDHLSEMSEATRKQSMPDQPDFGINALVITSRLVEPLGNLPKTVLEPWRIEGGRLSRFMDAYLEQRNKRHLFEDEEYFDACRRMSRMVGQRNITILLARLYAEQMIEQQQGGGGTLPASVPELMLSYVNQLNRAIEPGNRREIWQVQRAAQIIAWECLHETYRPTSAKIEKVLNILAPDADQAEAKERLKYLETRLRLVQTLEPGDRVRIILDPLAEYLAAIGFVDDLCRQSISLQAEITPNPAAESLQTTLWQQFFKSIDQVLEAENETGQIIQGFLLAVRDCCLLRQKQAGIPIEITEELARKAGLVPEDLQRAEEKRRIRLLISELSAPELEYRVRAAEDLAKRGATASDAIPNLKGMVLNRNQDLEARQAAVLGLAQIGTTGEHLRDEIAECLLSLVQDPAEDSMMRRSIAESLGVLKVGKAALLAILENDQEVLAVRQGAARAFGLMEAANGEPVPMLIVEQHEEKITTQVKQIPVFKTALTEDLWINWVEIPGGKFLMGSPPEEKGRDYYQYQSWAADTEGREVEKQHWVTITPFGMAQDPITQEQWQFIANLPKIEQDLSVFPSNFKGKNRPVESVSWDDAQEFCARLTQHTGKTHRLPSEAEWEYACRAGTLSPFHFGDTISASWVNYNATVIYGTGTPGEYRQGTTDVGLFGVTNRYGLADMHGNVYEWCADAWHPDYEGAPTDGTPWQAENVNDNRYRLLRGGSWIFIPACCRSAFRYRFNRASRDDTVGFRVVAVLSPTSLVRIGRRDFTERTKGV